MKVSKGMFVVIHHKMKKREFEDHDLDWEEQRSFVKFILCREHEVLIYKSPDDHLKLPA
jgi:hypothetical protein